jgi:hypothetical protein
MTFDPKGFEQNYTLGHPNFSFESIMFSSPSELRLPKMTSGAWYLYQPGQSVRNVNFAPWKANEFTKWAKHHANKEWLAAIKQEYGAKVPPFYQISSSYDSMKVKVFASTSLREVVEKMASTHQDKPILLIPFTCNAKADGSDKKISATGKCNGEAFLPIFDALVK